MLDPVTIDQLRTLVTVAEVGISRRPRAVGDQRVDGEHRDPARGLDLGPLQQDRGADGEGLAVLARARRVVAEMDALRAFTTELATGIEAKVSLCVASLFPIDALADVGVELAKAYPAVDLRVDTETTSTVSDRVLEGSATMGIVSPLGLRTVLEARALRASIRMVPVVGADHPLASAVGPIPTHRLAECVQLVLSERVPDQAVREPNAARTRHADCSSSVDKFIASKSRGRARPRSIDTPVGSSCHVEVRLHVFITWARWTIHVLVRRTDGIRVV